MSGELPTEPGLYWFREKEGDSWNIILLYWGKTLYREPVLMAKEVLPYDPSRSGYYKDCFPEGPKESSGVCGLINLKRWMIEKRPIGQWIKSPEPEEIGAIQKENERLQGIEKRHYILLRQNTSWPLTEILKSLIESAEILLSEKNYDGHGWELLAQAKWQAELLLASLRQDLDINGEKNEN